MSLALDLLRSRGFLAIILLLAGLPIYGPFLATAEAELFPVVQHFHIESVTPNAQGVEVRFTYTKSRLCEYRGSYVRLGTREIPSIPVGGDDPGTIGPGVTITRVWQVALPSLDGAEIWFSYRCHPLWALVEKVYP